MEIDEKLSYSLFVALSSRVRVRMADRRIHRGRSLQFDPAPRTGEPLVSRRVPDYFLVFSPSLASVDLLLILFDSKRFARRTRVLYIRHDPTISCSLNRSSSIYLYPENPTSLSIIEHMLPKLLAVPSLWVTEEPHVQRYPLRRHHVMTCLGFCLFMGHGHCLQRKEED